MSFQFNFKRVNTKPACKDCTERHVGCHSECAKYKEFKEQLQADKEAYFEATREENMYLAYMKKQANKRRKKEGKKEI